jgi:signal transduction histidine kinase
MVYHLTGLQESTQTIEMAIQRVSKIVFALKTYAHPDHQIREMVEADIRQGIEATLTIFQNQLRHGVEVVRHYAEVPPILCYPDELQQVWTNLIQNALQAMNYQGTLEIAVGSEQKAEEQRVVPSTQHPAPSTQYLVVSITDSGCGITEELKDNVFEPFFTTRPTGEGSGLGLNIARKIIEKHHGRIELHSQPGRTTFQIFLPHVQMQPLRDFCVK